MIAVQFIIKLNVYFERSGIFQTAIGVIKRKYLIKGVHLRHMLVDLFWAINL